MVALFGFAVIYPPASDVISSLQSRHSASLSVTPYGRVIQLRCQLLPTVVSFSFAVIGSLRSRYLAARLFVWREARM